MKQMTTNGFRAAMAPLVVYTLIFPVLAVDVAARLIARSAAQDTGNLLLLLYYEASRGVRTILGLILITLLLVRAAHRPAARALIVFLLFAVISYSMSFGSGGYVGPFQEWLTRTLTSLGATRWHLQLAFGYPAWPLWLALPGLLRFALLFPKELSPEDVERSGSQDRAGLLRGLPGAGLDIGAAMRRLLASLMRRGWLDPVNLWTIALFGSALSITLRHSGVRHLLWPGPLFALALAVTALRAGYMGAPARTRTRLRWLARASLGALVLIGMAGLVNLSDSETAAITGFVLVTAAPGLVLLGLGFAVLSVRESG